MDLESLREILKDNRQHIAIASIVRIELADDRSCLRCLVNVFPEQRELVAKMTWDSVGPNSGIFSFPVPGDMVLVAFADGDSNDLFVIKRLTSKTDKIPIQAVEGDTTVIALNGRRIWITSDQKIFISKGTNEPTEPLVLGNQLKTLLSVVLEKLSELSLKTSTHTHIGNLGYPTTPPNEAADFAQLQSFFTEKKADPVDNGAILSNIAFTEKGD